jgi:hypothetical protein
MQDWTELDYSCTVPGGGGGAVTVSWMANAAASLSPYSPANQQQSLAQTTQLLLHWVQSKGRFSFQKIYKNFQIFHHIESLDTYMKH